jgi:hypothetical protein
MTTNQPRAESASARTVRLQLRAAVIAALALLVASQPQVYRAGPRPVIDLMLELYGAKGFTTVEIIRGYYQDLNDFGWDLGRLYDRLPDEGNWIPFEGSEIAMPTEDIRGTVLKPSAKALFCGVQTETNRWGMRDRDYEKLPAPGTFRLAVIGPCTAMGWGVDVDQGLVRLLETKLNAGPVKPGIKRYEILNFAVAAMPSHNAAVHLEKQQVMSFHPQLVLMYVLPIELDIIGQLLEGVVDYPPAEVPDYVKEAIKKVPHDRSTVKARALLRQAAEEVARDSYRQIAAKVRAGGGVPVYLYTFDPGRPEPPPERERLLQHARDAGFITFDLTGMFNGDPQELKLREWDDHLNVKGHQLAAQAIYDALMSNPELKGLVFGGGH